MFAKYIIDKRQDPLYIKIKATFFPIEKIRNPVFSQNGVRRIRIFSHWKQL